VLRDCDSMRAFAVPMELKGAMECGFLPMEVESARRRGVLEDGIPL
jgi:hypothetical protein